MGTMKGNGVQKQARLNRLKNEIIEYVSSQPQCSAADIVDHLSNERKMRKRGQAIFRRSCVLFLDAFYF